MGGGGARGGPDARASGRGRGRGRTSSRCFPSPPAMAPAATPGAPTRGRAVVRPSRRDAAAEVVPREEGSPGAAAARAARAEARRGASARATDEAAHAITVLPVRVGRSVALRSLVRSPRRAARLCGRRNDLTRLVGEPATGGRDETARALKSGTGKTGLCLAIFQSPSPFVGRATCASLVFAPSTCRGAPPPPPASAPRAR